MSFKPAPLLALAGMLMASIGLCPPALAQQRVVRLPDAQASFVPLELAGHVGGLEPVLSVTIGQETKVYPLRILALHGVINDQVGKMPLALSYCGPCGTVGAFKRPAHTKLAAIYDPKASEMALVNTAGTQWSQRSGDGTAKAGKAPTMLSAAPSEVVSMARVRQAATADQVVLVLQDTPLSRVPTPKTLALPGSASNSANAQDSNDVAAANQTKVLDARSWSLDLLSPERRLGDEERLILLEKRPSQTVGPPKP